MIDKNITNDTNSFSNQLEEIKDNVDNQYNPGHWIGTGRVPLAIKGLKRYPILSLSLGIITLLFCIYMLKGSSSILNGVYLVMIPAIISWALIAIGIRGLKLKKNKS